MNVVRGNDRMTITIRLSLFELRELALVVNMANRAYSIILMKTKMGISMITTPHVVGLLHSPLTKT